MTGHRRTFLTTVACGTLWLASGMGCEVRTVESRAPTVEQADLPWVVLRFAPGEADLADGLPLEIDRLLGRPGGPLPSLLVMGFANESSDFDANLRIAESRAHHVADALRFRGISRDRILIAWSEAAMDDEVGGRVEVVLVRDRKALAQSARRSCVLPEPPACSGSEIKALALGTPVVERRVTFSKGRS
jgi:hypothetical protein